MKWILIPAALMSLLLSCTNNESLKKTDVNPNTVYFDYTVRGDDDDTNVTAYIQFKRGGPNGPALVLENPAKVELDGETIPSHIAKLTGTYYEIQKPLNSFIGKHTITFTDFDGKEYSEEFHYGRFSLKTEIPRIVNRGDLIIDFRGLGSEDKIRVSATDTSFASRDIVELDTAKNGRLIISAGKLKNLVNGPIILLLSKETEKPVENGTKAGGRIVVSYRIKKEFELRGKAPAP